MTGDVLLSAQCWPPLWYMRALAHSRQAVIEQWDTFNKRGGGNRYTILSANGPLPLSIPLIRNSASRSNEVRICYRENWQKRHWTALESAYRNSPYFEHLEHVILPFYHEKPEMFIDYVLGSLTTLKAMLKLTTSVTLSDTFQPPERENDRRILGKPVPAQAQEPYYQTFGERFGFVDGLSALDLLFNVGPKEAGDYLISSARI